jgi:hypothetical protein
LLILASVAFEGKNTVLSRYGSINTFAKQINTGIKNTVLGLAQVDEAKNSISRAPKVPSQFVSALFGRLHPYHRRMRARTLTIFYKVISST